MRYRNTHLTPFLLAGLIGTASVPNAFALEAEDVAERLKEALSEQQAEFDYESARLEGDDVTLEGVTIKSLAAEESLPLGTVVLQDVTEEQDGTYRIGTLEMDEFEHADDDITVSLTDLTVSELVLPADDASDPFGGMMRYDRLEVARVDVEGEDGPLASASNLYATAAASEEDQTMDASGGVESFSLNLGAIVDSGNAARMLEELGYEEITGSAVMEGSWQASDGRVTLSNYEATVDDAGTVSLMLDFAGYTPEFGQQLQEMTRAMEEQEGDEEKSMQGMAVLGLLQQLTFHSTAIRFTDDSLTEKVLDYAAEQQGGTQADIISQAKTAIPAQLTPFLGAELAGNVAEAVAAFLENPGNIEISANPDEPVPFAMLVGAAMSSPEMLVQQLGLAVQANQ